MRLKPFQIVASDAVKLLSYGLFGKFDAARTPDKLFRLYTKAELSTSPKSLLLPRVCRLRQRLCLPGPWKKSQSGNSF